MQASGGGSKSLRLIAQRLSHVSATRKLSASKRETALYIVSIAEARKIKIPFY